jgi:hypothetical protein
MDSPEKSVPSETGETFSDGNCCKCVISGQGIDNAWVDTSNCPIHAQNSDETTPKKVIGRPFEKGDPRINRGGRPKGSPVTDMLRRLFEEQPETIYSTMLGVFTGKSAVAKVMLLEKAAERLEGKVVQPVEGDINLNLGISDRLIRAKERIDGTDE